MKKELANYLNGDTEKLKKEQRARGLGSGKKVITINAKCSDMFSASFSNNGHHVGNYDGYVPDFFPGQHFGDYVELRIDIETGKILNWKKPTEKQLKETFSNERP